MRNLTAIKEYISHLEQFFNSDRMKTHLKFVFFSFQKLPLKFICRELDEFSDDKIPKHFDAREKWPMCPSLTYVPNQGGCGSCFVSHT